jgi:hypothetical protein
LGSATGRELAERMGGTLRLADRELPGASAPPTDVNCGI